MKKLLVLSLVTLFVLTMNIGAFAFDEDAFWSEYGSGYVISDEKLDGIEWTSGEAINVDHINRDAKHLDTNKKENDDDQEVEIKVTAEAYIPCYLELKVAGNTKSLKGQSFGPDAIAKSSSYGTNMQFDNEMGGFVDGDWKSLGYGKNVEVEPGDNVYIQACDLFKVDIYGNDNYKYEVESTGLNATDNTGENLPLDMRTSLDEGSSWGQTMTFDKVRTAPVVIADNIAATTTMTAYHQFRVPYTRTTTHGSYVGTVIFRTVSM